MQLRLTSADCSPVECRGLTEVSPYRRLYIRTTFVINLVFYSGGLFIFSIRADSFDPVELGYSSKFEEMEKAGKWSLVKRERRELYSHPYEERHRDCYLITYKVLKNC